MTARAINMAFGLALIINVNFGFTFKNNYIGSVLARILPSNYFNWYKVLLQGADRLNNMEAT
jgi:hypothetical protein